MHHRETAESSSNGSGNNPLAFTGIRAAVFALSIWPNWPSASTVNMAFDAIGEILQSQAADGGTCAEIGSLLTGPLLTLVGGHTRGILILSCLGMVPGHLRRRKMGRIAIFGQTRGTATMSAGGAPPITLTHIRRAESRFMSFGCMPPLWRFRASSTCLELSQHVFPSRQ